MGIMVTGAVIAFSNTSDKRTRSMPISPELYPTGIRARCRQLSLFLEPGQHGFRQFHHRVVRKVTGRSASSHLVSRHAMFDHVPGYRGPGATHNRACGLEAQFHADQIPPIGLTSRRRSASEFREEPFVDAHLRAPIIQNPCAVEAVDQETA